MKNPLIANVSHKDSFYIILVLLMAALVLFWAFRLELPADAIIEALPVHAQSVPDSAPTPKPIKAAILPKNSYTAQVTAFSAVEYCAVASIQRKYPDCSGQTFPRPAVALNAKYGHAKAIYIPAYDKTYKVIGTTDYKTDVDIWFGADHDGANQHGRKTLLINIIR